MKIDLSEVLQAVDKILQAVNSNLCIIQDLAQASEDNDGEITPALDHLAQCSANAEDKLQIAKTWLERTRRAVLRWHSSQPEPRSGND